MCFDILEIANMHLINSILLFSIEKLRDLILLRLAKENTLYCACTGGQIDCFSSLNIKNVNILLDFLENFYQKMTTTELFLFIGVHVSLCSPSVLFEWQTFDY